MAHFRVHSKMEHIDRAENNAAEVLAAVCSCDSPAKFRLPELIGAHKCAGARLISAADTRIA